MSDLGELGLSSYEEQVYRALLSLGAATAQEVADVSGVPMGRIYDVLNGLDARDVVRSQSTEPTTYAAVDPDVAVERLLAERRRELAAQAERYEAIAESVGPELAATTPAESRFWTAPLGSDAAVSLERDLFAAADQTVRSAMGPPYADAPWDAYAAEVDPFYDAVGDEVTVRVLGHARPSGHRRRRWPPRSTRPRTSRCGSRGSWRRPSTWSTTRRPASTSLTPSRAANAWAWPTSATKGSPGVWPTCSTACGLMRRRCRPSSTAPTRGAVPTGASEGGVRTAASRHADLAGDRTGRYDVGP